VWDLFASGTRREQQRDLIAHAIGPVWEANHVWLILVVVLLFSCFPAAFAHISTELHIPLTLMLVGIVLRGSAFTFRSYDTRESGARQGWGLTFSIASVMTPVLLGICVGTVASGNIPMRNVQPAETFTERFVTPWLTPFALSVGLMTLSLCALLAATYLTVEAKDAALKNDFRKRAFCAAAAVTVMAAVTGYLAERDAPLVFNALTSGIRSLTLLTTTSLFAALFLWALQRRHFRLARVAVAGVTVFIIWGWAWAQFPYLVPPDRTITTLAAPRATLEWTLGVLILGTVILLPSFIYLFRVFKSGDRPFQSPRISVNGGSGGTGTSISASDDP
jgi:cytochrome d ubiquinol oxidase subunit II